MGSFSRHDDLSAVAAKLKARGIPHRFILAGAEQQLVLPDTDSLPEVESLLEQWRSGQLGAPEPTPPQLGLRCEQRPAPLTLGILFLGFVGTALTAHGPGFIGIFTFWEPPLYLDAGKFGDVANGELWRLITPVFLHFGPIHILFNALWIWYLGSIVEFGQGVRPLLLLFVSIGVVSNTAQALVTSTGIFGGFSGVVYGLLAYSWLWGTLNRTSPVRLPTALFTVFSGLMILSTTGVFDILAGGDIADTAHISGYITGLVCAGCGSLFNWNNER